ncbi:MAG: hypothetical protein R2856_29085 [Caldilineaceae bacterium]
MTFINVDLPAVLTQQRQNFAAPQRQIHILVGDHAGEVFGNLPRFKDRDRRQIGSPG